MALPRSHAGVRLRAKAHPARAAIFSAPDSWGAPARIHQVTCVLVARRLDPRLKLQVPTSNFQRKYQAPIFKLSRVGAAGFGSCVVEFLWRLEITDCGFWQQRQSHLRLAVT